MFTTKSFVAAIEAEGSAIDEDTGGGGEYPGEPDAAFRAADKRRACMDTLRTTK